MDVWNTDVLRQNCPGNQNRSDRLRHIIGTSFSLIVRLILRRMPRQTYAHSQIEISPIAVDLARLGPQFEGYRIVHLSDIHFGTWVDEERLEFIVEQVNQQHPHMIVITGDFISYLTTPLFERITPWLSLLAAEDGVFTVRGNHDCWVCPGQFEKIMSRSRIQILNNRVFTLRRAADCMHVCGIDTTFYGQGRLEDVMAQLPGDGPAILLAHEPDIADNAAAYGRFDLQLSGHTHGGQIVFPLIGSPWLPRLARKYPRGLYRLGDMLLYTNRGIGTASLPWRFRCPPEIAVFTLHSPQPGG